MSLTAHFTAPHLSPAAPPNCKGAGKCTIPYDQTKKGVLGSAEPSLSSLTLVLDTASLPCDEGINRTANKHHLNESAHITPLLKITEWLTKYE